MIEQFMRAVAEMQRPSWFVRLAIRVFVRLYRVDVAAAKPADAYCSLLEFFLREPASGSRPIAPESGSIIAPVDAVITACGVADSDALVLVKGHTASLAELAGEKLDAFEGGAYLMLYLSPADIHRIYAPCAGSVRRSWQIEGVLRPVCPKAVARMPRTFVTNRRVVTEIESSCGRVLMIKVGARNVGRIVTHHPVPLPDGTRHEYRKGDELGWFELGSTVILVFERSRGALRPGLETGHRVRIGEEIGRGV